ncbi:hypothetical protein JCM6882_006471 [Rhodosporidiobolus microsporus]
MARPTRATAKQVSYKEDSDDEEVRTGDADEGTATLGVGGRRKRLLEDSDEAPAKRFVRRDAAAVPPISRLPPGLLHHVLSTFANSYAPSAKATLAAACLVSRSFLALARPLLYRTLSLTVGGYPDGGWWILDPASDQLCETLQRAPHLAALVRTVRFKETSFDFEYDMSAKEMDPWGPHLGFDWPGREYHHDDHEDEFWKRLLDRTSSSCLEVFIPGESLGEGPSVWETVATLPQLLHLTVLASSDEQPCTLRPLDLGSVPHLKTLKLLSYPSADNLEDPEDAAVFEELRAACAARGIEHITV